MRILLIDPPFYRFMGFYNRYFPVGLVSIGTVLRDAGHEVFICDADFNERPSLIDYTRLTEHYERYLHDLQQTDHPILTGLRETIRRVDPDVTGISIWTTYAASALRTAEICKDLFPDRPVIMGGPHATAKADEVLRIAPAVDYVIRGEGEWSALALVEQMAGGHVDRASIPGLLCRDGGAIHHTPSGERSRDLDEFPFPDRELLMNHERYTPEDMGLIMTSRGCPYSCSYCATETRRTSYRSTEHILREIRAVKSRYGTIQFSFKDDSFTVNKRRVEELCDRIITERLRIRWECTTRANLVTEDLLRRMKKAGCNGIKIGIESGSERVLGQMNKGLTLGQMREAAEMFRRTGIYWTGFFMMGVPGETVDEIYQTLEFMHELRPDHAHIGTYEPFPGTAMFQEGVQRGLIKTDMTLRDFFATLPNDYYKTDARRQVDTIDGEVFERLEREMKARFHAHNKSVARLLKRAKSRAGLYLAQPALLLADFRQYLSWA
jgi:radical SAM superfamily enzyme YgiQ (UPF0313 family)